MSDPNENHVDEEDEEEHGLTGKELGLEGVGNMDVFENSMCMYCHGTGKTRVLIHKVPYFREIVISSFRCDDCYDSNTEVGFGGEIQIQGCKYTLEMKSEDDLNRQLIKSDSAAVRIAELDLEIPPGTQKGEISTIEGFLRTAAKNLGISQESRMEQNAAVGAQVAQVISGLTMMAMGDKFPFSIVVDDPAGNSFIQNPCAPHKDPNMSTTYYQRTPEQSIALGLQPEKGDYRDDSDSNFAALATGAGFGKRAPPTASAAVSGASGGMTDAQRVVKAEEDVLGRTEAVSLPSYCPNCGQNGESLTALTDIPHFKEVIIMSFTCKVCGYRNNEVKGGGAIPSKGTQITLTVACEADMHRDVLKSDSCAVNIPCVELEMQNGSLGGTYTTVEGMMDKIIKNLTEGNPFAVGDSSTNNHSEREEVRTTKSKFRTFLANLASLGRGDMFPFDIVMRDPLGNSFFSPRIGLETAPVDDAQLTFLDFKRSWDEDEQFGLNDINTRDFETGVDYHDGEEVLPDRLTHILPKSIDHPHEFAKGMEDSQSGGVYRGKVDGAVSQEGFLKMEDDEDGAEAEAEKEKEEMEEVEVGAESAAGSETPATANADADADAGFEPSAVWVGVRPGFAFKRGAQGQGYYTDVSIAESVDLVD